MSCITCGQPADGDVCAGCQIIGYMEWAELRRRIQKQRTGIGLDVLPVVQGESPGRRNGLIMRVWRN